MILPNAVEMRDLDRSAIDEFLIPGIVLMENAGLGTVRMMEELLGSAANTFTLIFIGPGNNGGDGLVIGRHLHQRGSTPLFIFLVNPDTLKSDAAANWAIVRKLQLPFHVLDTNKRVQLLPTLYTQSLTQGKSCYAIVDAIFGIGLSRPVVDHFADAIHFINNIGKAHDIPVIAVDIPSGMDSDNGKPLGSCIRAQYTATYGCAKPGHFLHHGPDYTGKLNIHDIGIPHAVIQRAGITTELIDRTKTTELISSLKRRKTTHKGSHGHLAVLAGSIGKTGAAILTVQGALLSGTGLITLFTPENLNTIYEPVLVEAMTFPLPGSSSFLGIGDSVLIQQSLIGKKAIILGPGLGTDTATANLVVELFRTVEIPMVVDADALNILARHKNNLPAAAGPRIFTPHPGEMARMLDSTPQDIQNNRLAAAQEACHIYGKGDQECIMVLKGTGTVVTSSNGSVYINSSGNSGMATGGMGDVLAGIIGGLLCQHLPCENAAAAGVFLHGMAGDKLYEKTGFGYTATELAQQLPGCIADLLQPS